MGLQLGYMGTKKYLAPYVHEVFRGCRNGPVLDVFAGMGSVGETLANERPLWINDVQQFATEVGHALFVSRTPVPKKKSIEQELISAFCENSAKLRRRFGAELSAEAEALAKGTVTKINEADKLIVSRLASPLIAQERKRLAENSGQLPYRLFTLGYSGRFFGLRQAIDIDSLRYAVDSLTAGDATPERKRWLLVAMGVVMVRIATSTGHFAQYLAPKDSNLSFVLGQRKRRVLNVFWDELSRIEPVGTSKWRAGNRVYNSDAVSLLQRMHLFGDAPAVVYADPPYTDDQYSRFYHLWETLVLYDYPVSIGKGCYRTDRFQTPFALISKVEEAIDELSSSAARLGAQLVLSYPANGLLLRKQKTVREVVLRHYKRCDIAYKLNHAHSTMGGSKGHAKQNVEEMIFFAEN